MDLLFRKAEDKWTGYFVDFGGKYMSIGINSSSLKKEGNEMASKIFKNWLEDQTNRNDPIGDLARDVKTKYLAKKTPRGNSGLKAWIKHLENYSACAEAFEALNEAWREYQESEAV